MMNIELSGNEKLFGIGHPERANMGVAAHIYSESLLETHHSDALSSSSEK